MAGYARRGDGVSEKLDGIEPVKALLDQFATSLAQVIESMAEQRPGAEWQAVSGSISEVAAGAQDEMLWWEQPLQISPEMKIWVGAPQAAWEHAGGVTLKAAGIEVVETSEARNTWLEILGQALSPVARAIGGILRREVTCEGGAEGVPDGGIDQWGSVALSFESAPVSHLLVAFSLKLLEVVSSNLDSPEDKSADPAADAGFPPARSRTMNLLLDVDLPVSISFGKTRLPMKDVLKLTTGSIVELNRGVNEPVEVLVNECLIARGEVVVVEGNYGVRIIEIATRQERLRTLR
jgi:flagellar motor switch protein FliN/FliY